MKTKLTIEQSQKLIDLNISPNKASDVAVFNDDVSQWINRGTPIFTLTDIFKLLPPKKSFADAEAYLNIHFELAGFKWCVQYLDFENDDEVIAEEYANELIDAMYSLCLWCIEKKYITT